MNIEFLGGVRTVTGSATLFEKGSLKWLVDCGMFQGGRSLEERNWNVRPYRPRDLSFILLTHAHIDHSGLIPKLVKEGFRGRVFCTKPTFELCQLMLTDSAHIQEMEADWQNRKNRRSGLEEKAPLYTPEDVEKGLRYFTPIHYGEMVSVAEGVRVRFQDAGHILGSAIIELWIDEGGRERKFVFSGDLGNVDQPLIRDPSPVQEADILWLESTYGNRLHKSREETVQELLKIIQDALRNQGKVIIPAFAVERTQDIIYTIGQLIRKGSIPSIPVYVDSPLAISATEVFRKNADCFDQETEALLLAGGDPLEIPEITFTRTTEESKSINEDKRAGVIISASGMCDSGRIQHHLKHHLWRENSHIVIIGYQADGALGRRIVDGARTVRLFGEEIAVKAHVHTLGGFSAHADQKRLLDWLGQFDNPDLEVIVNHGEEKVSLELSQLIGERLHLRTSVPQWREKRSLFASEGKATPEEAMEGKGEGAIPPSQETGATLFRQLDRHYKKLRRIWKSLRSKGKDIQNPRNLRQLEEINEKLENLESELDRL